MKYASLDLETSGLSPVTDQILQVSFVVEDTTRPEVPVENLPHFTCFVKHKRIEGGDFALAMNGWILDIISGRNKTYKGYPVLTAYPASTVRMSEDGVSQGESIYWVDQAKAFLKTHFGKDRVTIAGKNVAGFDIPFLPQDLRGMLRHKALDPATLYVDWTKDNQAPGLEECKKRAGIDTPVAHDAREDAMDVIRLLRAFYAK